MTSPIDRMRPSLLRRLLPYDRRQKLIAWGTPILFLVCTVSIIIAHDPSRFVPSHARRPHSEADHALPRASVDWNSLDWTSFERLSNPLTPTPITVHGNLSSSVSELYTKGVKDFNPRWLKLEHAFVSPTGHVIYKEQPYPPNNPLFPQFESGSLEALKEDNLSFPRVIPIQIPPDMHPIDGLLYILPLLFATRPNDSQESVYVLPRRFINPVNWFISNVTEKVNMTITHNSWVIGDEIFVPEIPQYEEVSATLLLKLKAALHPKYYLEHAQKKSCLLLPHNDKMLKVTDHLVSLKKAGVRLVQPEDFPDPLVTLEMITQFGCALWFQNKLLALSAFRNPGFIVIEVQKPDFVSRSALIASALGLNVHVFVDQDGAIDIAEIAKLIKRAK